ncbi:ubiquitin-like-specific protease 1A [Miscanthus floridulus]|uniref:ubiquitin-like-specific protease 1A n=1 Tax=Miscanthus floridulus TaxID=154761 RepID=UPI0034597802
MECLFQPYEYLSNEVIDAYIKLLKAQEGLKKRPGGTVYLETACLVAIMKRDGEKNETIEANYPNCGTSQRPGLVQRVLAYLKHDMVFLPINVTNTHWYLAAINVDKREVQVLDSLGEMFGRVDLNKIRGGLRKQIYFILEETGPKEHKWLDVEVDTWPVREIFRGKLL